jgi:hypothetical protein
MPKASKSKGQSKISKAKAGIAGKKIVEDKTFGMKNKNRSKKVQQKIAHQHQAGGGHSLSAAEQQARALKKAKETQDKRRREMEMMFKEAPKSRGQIAREKEAAERAKKMPSRQAKSGKIDLYADPRAEKDARKTETSADWDLNKLKSVVNMKAVAEKRNTTEIVCKYFLDAVEKGLYGWFWHCPGGKNCQYRHNLPPGFVLKKKKTGDEQDEEEEGPSLEEIIEEKRAKLTSEGTPVTLATFMEWKKRKQAEKQVKQEEQKEKSRSKLTKAQRSLGVGMSGRELFEYKPDAFKDDEGAADDIEEFKGTGATAGKFDDLTCAGWTGCYVSPG